MLIDQFESTGVLNFKIKSILMLFFCFSLLNPDVFSQTTTLFPAFSEPVDEGYFSGSPGQISTYIAHQRRKVEKFRKEIDRLLQTVNQPSQIKLLENAAGYFDGLVFQFNRLEKEIRRPKERMPELPEKGQAPFNLSVLEKYLVFLRSLIIRSEEYKNRLNLQEELAENIEHSLKPLLADYIQLKNEADIPLKVYVVLGQIWSLQVEYGHAMFRIDKLKRNISKIDQLIEKAKWILQDIFESLAITREDVEKAREEYERAQESAEERRLDRMAELDRIERQINIYEIKLDNILQQLAETSLTTLDHQLFNAEKSRLEMFIEGLHFQKNSLDQERIEDEIRCDLLGFRFQWKSYYIQYPERITYRRLLDICLKNKEIMESKEERLQHLMDEKQTGKSIISKLLVSTSQQMDTVSDEMVIQALKSLRDQCLKTSDLLDSLILKISENLDASRDARNEIEITTDLIQRKIGWLHRALSAVWKFSGSAVDPVKTVLYYPLGSIGASTVTIAGLIKLIVFITVGIYFLKKIKNRISVFLRDKLKLAPGTVNSITSLSYYFMLVLIVLAGVSTAGVNLSQVTVILGALGVGIGFGLQTIANNFISGLILLAEQTIKVGDIIELEDGTMGEVRTVSIRSTVIRTADGLDIIVPNSDFVSNKVTTWTYGDIWRRLKIPFGVAYGSDPEQVAEVASQAARSIEGTMEDDTHPVRVLFDGFGDSSIDFTLIVWRKLNQFQSLKSILSDYYFALFRAFKENNIEIPFNQLDVHLRTLPPQSGSIRDSGIKINPEKRDKDER